MECSEDYHELVSKYREVSPCIKDIISHCNSKKYATSDMGSLIVLLEDLAQRDVYIEGSDIEFERNVLELLEFETYTMMGDYEQLKNRILELASCITSISENQNLPLLLNILMDGVRAYNSMINKQSKSPAPQLEMSFWSIKDMDSIYATNGGNTTLLDYTLEKIQDQFPSVLRTFEEMNYLEKILTRCKISEIHRGILRLNFGLNRRIKALEECIIRRMNSEGEHLEDRSEQNNQLVLKIESLREVSDYLKSEFVCLIKDILFFSKYLGLDNRCPYGQEDDSICEADAESIKETYEDLISEIETVCEMFQNGQAHKTREIMDRIISDLDIREMEEILSALNLLNWLKGRVSICLGLNLGSKMEEISTIYGDKRHALSREDIEDERALDHQETRYYEDM
ncbi:hypothetical protein OIY81_577 [Cryptosporidium canis]|nr:hypothetical protein OIY81_577 [Cryptosporidium canis]